LTALTYVATKNRGKLGELQAIFTGTPLELRAYEAYADVAEGEASFHDNAVLKVRALHAQLRRGGIDAAALADDSGLEVDALGGRPGVLSARYAGVDASWEERRRRLLEEMRGVPDSARSARFVCVIVFMVPDGAMWSGRGVIEGRIPSQGRGTGGFGYDPIFIPSGESLTLAELGEARKNAISHRRRAADALLATLLV
jgi:XTP/dITP diphosphohydrolase